MDIITLDFETYWAQDYSLSLKETTTESYIRDSRFQIIGLAVKVNNGETAWLSGTHKQVKKYLHDNYDWANSALLAHNTLFDGAIASWILGIHPKVLLDTLSMARAVHGVNVGGSLAYLAKLYKLGEKGTEVIDAKGKRLEDFSEQELSTYGDYCINDVELTYNLFAILNRKFPRKELRVIDHTLKMFTEPALLLDVPKLEGHLLRQEQIKQDLVNSVTATKKNLMSNPQFAKLLEERGVAPPMKISLTTGKPTFAFAKKDPGFKALMEHEDPVVQALCAARVGVKSTLEESRTSTLLGIAERNNNVMPVPIKYYAAHTGRWGGMDKLNVQNFPSRGDNGKVLKSCIMAPPGYVVVDTDSAQIEARVLAWLADQDDLVAGFAAHEDVYKQMAVAIYGLPIEEVTASHRFVGKQTVLGCGYGMGAAKFKAQLATFNVHIDIEEAQRIIDIYRSVNKQIKRLWRRCNNMLESFIDQENYVVDPRGWLKTIPEYYAVQMPSGLLLRYPDLQVEEGEKGPQYSYSSRKGRVKIYGGKVVENLCQGIARCVIAEQMLRMARRYRTYMTVHDSLIALVPLEELEEALPFMATCMRWAPEWATGLPLDCDINVGSTYGGVEKWKENPETKLWHPLEKAPHGPTAA